MRRGWQAASLVFLAVSVFGLVHSLQLTLTDPLGPGPGFFPFWLSAAGLCLSALLLIQVTVAQTGPQPDGSVLPDRPGTRRVAGVLVGLAAVAMLLDPLGFRLTALGFLVFLLIALGTRTWWLIAVVALAGSFGVFHVFSHWLNVPLPVGAWGI